MNDPATKQDIADLELRVELRLDSTDRKIDKAVEDISEIIRTFMTQVDARFRRLEESRHT